MLQMTIHSRQSTVVGQLIDQKDSFAQQEKNADIFLPFLYLTFELVCQLIQQKSIWAIFTSQSLPINWIIPSIANNLYIPNIQSIWDYSNSKKIFDGDLKTNFSINIYPDASLLSQSYRDWTEQSDIKALTIIYERKEGK